MATLSSYARATILDMIVTATGMYQLFLGNISCAVRR